MRIPDEYVCDLCETLFMAVHEADAFCPNCGSSQIRREIGYNELSDEDVYMGILHGKEKGHFIG